jgi:1,4-alpha-glucan branching enzyme
MARSIAPSPSPLRKPAGDFDRAGILRRGACRMPACAGMTPLRRLNAASAGACRRRRRARPTGSRRFVQHLVQRRRHRAMHRHRIVAFDEVRPVAAPFEQARQLVAADACKQRRVGDLVPVQVQDRQRGTVGRRIHELVRVPCGRQRTGLRLAVADHARGDQIRIVEHRAVRVRERVAQFAALVDRAGHLRRDVARNAAGKAELLEQPLHSVGVERHLRIKLAVRALQIHVRDQRGSAMAGAGDVDQVQIARANHAVQVHVDEVQSRRGAPAAEQPRLHMFARQYASANLRTPSACRVAATSFRSMPSAASGVGSAITYGSDPIAPRFDSNTLRRRTSRATVARRVMSALDIMRSRHSQLTEHDVYLLREGTHGRLYDRLGCHLDDGGAHFALWAPNARAVAVIGDFNGWNASAHPLAARVDGCGVWEGFVPGVQRGQTYKFALATAAGATFEKADPFAFQAECPPATASRVATLDYEWHDDEWMARRGRANALDAPMAIYEVHFGSWRRGADGTFLDYRSAAHALAEYVTKMGFTHVELLPITEHPFYGSWGYQCTGYFAPTARYGAPQDFMAFVDTLHRAGIGVILDWVPSHFPADAHGLACFDGTYLYEHQDPRQGFHPEWSSSIFNYGRHEVRAFLLSSALFWLERYHIDGLRVDAVASMLYLDYARKAGEWIPNRFGGKENLEAIEFLRLLSQSVYRDHPDVQLIAEESTAWPMVSRPTWVGGLGFGLKWNMGWMHDTLAYFKEDPVYRRYHHNTITFSIMYAFSENFVLPLSHDEVVHGKGSLIGRMPGDGWQQFANLRLLLGYMWTHPGKKLLFMGGEFGQRREWTHDGELEWWVLRHAEHAGVQRWLADVNRVYRALPALHAADFDPSGFEWIDCNDADNSVLSFLRLAPGAAPLVVVCNFTPVPRQNYAIGVPVGGRWIEVLNSDATVYGGSGMGNLGAVDAAPVSAHGRPRSLTLTLPPLAIVVLAPQS